MRYALVAAAVVLLVFAPSLPAQEANPFFESKEGNYTLTIPAPWKQGKSPNAIFQLVLSNEQNAILVSGLVTETTPEDLLATIEQGQRVQATDFHVLSREETTVAGERALSVRAQATLQGLPSYLYLIVFTHQGVAYRVLGIKMAGRRADFEAGLATLLGSFQFLADRTEWRARFEGKPARTVLLGGLVSFELNRPRWVENTFDQQKAEDYLEHACFRFSAAGAWVWVRARETTSNAAAELDNLGRSFAARMRNPQVTPATYKGSGGELRGLQVAEEQPGNERLYRMTVVVADGVLLEVWLESLKPQVAVTQRDWEQLLVSLKVESRAHPAEPPAYPCIPVAHERAKDPALAAFLDRGTLVLPQALARATLAVTPDGSHALIHDGSGAAIEDLTTHQRVALALDPAPTGRVHWSRDGRRLAWSAGAELLVATLDPVALRRVKLATLEAEFGPGLDELLACESLAPAGALDHLPRSRLALVAGGDAAPKPLLDYPFARIEHLALSPDGKQLALVANRDYPRTARVGGHIYVAAADGSGLRQLTKAPEEIVSLAWAADGRSLLAVRRVVAGKDGRVGDGGTADLYRIALETGEAVNLTRSGHIDRVWPAGDDLLVEVVGWDAATSQRGLYRIAVRELEAATAARPVPPAADRERQARVVSDRVRACLGATAWRDVVPTPELLERLARAFAEGVAEAYGVALDSGAAALDRLPTLVYELGIARGADPLPLLGLGAYYGETLRRAGGAAWRLRPVPFGEWVPGTVAEQNPLVTAVLPFSDVYVTAIGSERCEGMHGSQGVQADGRGAKMLLVYPPAYAEEAVRAATPPEYLEALRLLDAGDAKAGLDLLLQEVERRPGNGALAAEAIKLAEAAGMPDAARAVARRAVAAGSDVPELLVRCGDDALARDPAAAIDFYRKAVRGPWPDARALIRLGRAYAATARQPLAESCWRRAWFGWGPADQKQEIRQLMGMAESKEDPGDE